MIITKRFKFDHDHTPNFEHTFVFHCFNLFLKTLQQKKLQYAIAMLLCKQQAGAWWQLLPWLPLPLPSPSTHHPPTQSVNLAICSATEHTVTFKFTVTVDSTVWVDEKY